MYTAKCLIARFMNDQDREFALQAEAVLNASKDLCTLSQIKKQLNAAYSLVVKKKLYDNLTSDTMMVINIRSWGTKSRAPRKPIKIHTFCKNALKCQRRAQLECERRFFGNKGTCLVDCIFYFRSCFDLQLVCCGRGNTSDRTGYLSLP